MMHKASTVCAYCLVPLLTLGVGGSTAAASGRDVAANEPANDAGAAKQLTLDLGKGVTMKLALIPAGKFKMGNQLSAEETTRRYGGQGQEQKLADEYPCREVTISKPFYMGIYEVSQAQWSAVMGTEPWKGATQTESGDDYPASWVTSYDAIEFCRKLSEKSGRTVSLPTEAQWEYACRAGSETAFSFGDDASKIDDYAWHWGNARNAGEAYAHRVGQKKPNAWGLYDMHGNVWEVCSDWYDKDFYARAPNVDPENTTETALRSARGGSWHNGARIHRSSIRSSWTGPAYVHYNYGFRVVVTADSEANEPGKQAAEVKAPGIPSAFTNDVGVRFVLAPAGEFMMGSADDEEGRYDVEGPRHKVTIGKPFYIAIHQVTQGQWESVMGTRPWDGEDKQFGTRNCPSNAVNHVTWDDAMAFCARLGEKDGRTYRLPTEAEWEYACRAGSTTRYGHGDDTNRLAEYAWYMGTTWDKEDERYVHAVGQKKPNSWGIFDMHGNVWEMTMDAMHGNYDGAPADGSAWIKDGNTTADGTVIHPLRGGGFRSTDRRVRTASRHAYAQTAGSYYVGFRVVCEVRSAD